MTTSPKDQELIREVAEEIVGMRLKTSIRGNSSGPFKYYMLKGVAVSCLGSWNPLTNANHERLVAEKCISMGLAVRCLELRNYYEIEIGYADKEMYFIRKSTDTKKDWPRTKLTAYLEAIRRMK